MNEVSLSRKLFGKEVEIAVWDVEENLAGALIGDSYSEGLRLQKIFNFFDEKSTLSQLNKKRRLKVPQEFLEVLNKALEICRITEGKYDISLGKQFMQRKNGRDVTPVNCSYKDIKIEGNIVELLHPDVLIDFGSIAKGYIADKMAEVLKSGGVISGLIDARGDIIAFGEHESIIEVQHPREKEKSVLPIKIKNEGVATSGDYSQYHKNFDNCHIINKSDFISVTATAPTLMEADAYATAIFVTPETKVEKLLKNNKKIKILCIDNNLKIKKYNKFDEVIHKNEV